METAKEYGLILINFLLLTLIYQIPIHRQNIQMIAALMYLYISMNLIYSHPVNNVGYRLPFY